MSNAGFFCFALPRAIIVWLCGYDKITLFYLPIKQLSNSRQIKMKNKRKYFW